MSLVSNTLLKVTVNNFKQYKFALYVQNIHRRYLNMEQNDEMKNLENTIASKITLLAPSLTVSSKYKGQAGKIGVIGGSAEYTGAPYFAAITALKTGADIVHVFCSKEAAIPIKTYSPELIVHALLDDEGLAKLKERLEVIDVLLIGPGLGRNAETFKIIRAVINFWKEKSKPMVLDADALFLLSQESNLLKRFRANVILTPNIIEMARLLKTTPAAIKYDDIGRFIIKCDWDHVSIIVKGEYDNVYSENKRLILNLGGSGRRCGGQGDLLAGALSVFLNWSKQMEDSKAFFAAYAACKLTRECNSKAFSKNGRSMMVTDMIEEIRNVFKHNFENEN